MKTFIFEGSFVLHGEDLEDAVDQLVAYVSKHREDAFVNVAELED